MAFLSLLPLLRHRGRLLQKKCSFSHSLTSRHDLPPYTAVTVLLRRIATPGRVPDALWHRQQRLSRPIPRRSRTAPLSSQPSRHRLRQLALRRCSPRQLAAASPRSPVAFLLSVYGARAYKSSPSFTEAILEPPSPLQTSLRSSLSSSAAPWSSSSSPSPADTISATRANPGLLSLPLGSHGFLGFLVS